MSNPDDTGIYKYRLVNEHRNSDIFGNCEVCGGYASEMWYMTEANAYFDPLNMSLAWTYYNCRDYWGHHDCLVAVMEGKNNQERRPNGSKQEGTQETGKSPI